MIYATSSGTIAELVILLVVILLILSTCIIFLNSMIKGIKKSKKIDDRRYDKLMRDHDKENMR